MSCRIYLRDFPCPGSPVREYRLQRPAWSEGGHISCFCLAGCSVLPADCTGGYHCPDCKPEGEGARCPGTQQLFAHPAVCDRPLGRFFHIVLRRYQSVFPGESGLVCGYPDDPGPSFKHLGHIPVSGPAGFTDDPVAGCECRDLFVGGSSMCRPGPVRAACPGL